MVATVVGLNWFDTRFSNAAYCFNAGCVFPCSSCLRQGFLTKVHGLYGTAHWNKPSPPHKWDGSSHIAQDIAMPPEAPNDFAVALHLSEKHGVIFMITKAGYLFMFDVATASMLMRTKVSQDTVFISTASAVSG